MRNSTLVMMLLLSCLGLSACATPHASQDAQRSHAEKAQDELSSEVHK